ncbi:hypothetical protein RND81_01G066100 [Saponaria officinalis]|uniref:Uncharacterized protein n=1 Tax=Saponaria officinalis TaxID=3572 RepID=A0AAW1NCZ1_SAPOF
MSQTQVYAPPPPPTKSGGQLWKTMLNWVAFFAQIFVQIVRGTPSAGQVFSYIGFSQTLYLSPPPSNSGLNRSPLSRFRFNALLMLVVMPPLLVVVGLMLAVVGQPSSLHLQIQLLWASNLPVICRHLCD